ncbi:MAG: PilN domain-containing protein [Nitrospirota bacterium]
MRIEINFASREYLLLRKAYLALAVAIAAAVLLFVYNYGEYRNSVQKVSSFSAQLALQQRIASEMDSKLVQIKKEVGGTDVKAALSEAEFANNAIARRVFSWTAFLNRLEEVVPAGVGITSVSPDFTTLEMNISGTALSSNQLMEFVDRLTKSKYFEEIPPDFHTSELLVDKDIGMTVQKFTLKIKYNPDGTRSSKSPYDTGVKGGAQ